MFVNTFPELQIQLTIYVTIYVRVCDCHENQLKQQLYANEGFFSNVPEVLLNLWMYAACSKFFQNSFLFCKINENYERKIPKNEIFLYNLWTDRSSFGKIDDFKINRLIPK